MWEAVITSLVNNLGGTAGFGEFSLARNDDASTPFIDLRPIFGAQGINFFGHYYTGFYLNNNGSVTFNAATSSFTPTAITGSTSNPVIAAYWADIDTRGGTVTPTAGGTSTGSNLLWYDLDATTHTFTATWDDVGYYNSQTNKLNAFQLSIQEINDQGDFDIIYRYENIDWTTGNASGGSNGLGGTPARAGYSAGNGTEYFELPQSGNQASLLALESASNVGTPGTFVFSVRNGMPTVGVTAGDASVDEGDGTAVHYVSIPVFLTEASASTVTVHYSTANGTALAGQDYVAQSGTLTFAAGVTQQNILVAVIGDAVIEDSEAFTVTLSDPSAGASILDGSATGTIDDDDAALSIAAASADVAEGDAGTTAFTFTVTRTGDTARPATANWAVSGPAVNGADFAGGALPSGTVTLGIGETSKTITLHVAGDTQIEGDESFTVTLSDPGPGTTIGTASATGIIRNDDVTPASLSIAATNADQAEGQSGSTEFTFTVTRSGDLDSAASAHWTVGGAQVDGADFTSGELPSGVVSFAAGESSKVITVDIAGDTAVESNEAFTVTLSDASAGAVIDTASASGTIRNDDTSLSIAAASADKTEGDLGATAFTFTVTRAGDLAGTASVNWAVTDEGTIDSDFIPTEDLLEFADYLSFLASSVDLFFPGTSLFGGLLPSGTVSFAAGESTKTVTVWALGETVLEGDESFAVTLSDASAGTVIDTSSAVGTIRNDDGPPAGLVSISDVTVTEGDGGTELATFTVTRTGGTSAFSVDYATADGTAMVADGDYATTSGTLHFDDGVDVQTFSVLVNGDSVFESDEVFFVDLSGATHGAVLGVGTGEGTILNDDIAPGPTTLMGTPGDDNLNGGPADDIIIGLAGSDILGGGAGNDSLDGGPGTDLLIGGAGADTFSGGDGDDYLLIDSEDTAIDGGAGFDSAFVLTGAAVTMDMGAASIEWAEGNAGADTFNAASQTSAVYIYGDGGTDTLTGSAFGDYLDGGNGADTLAGGDGDDLLVGNGGSDIMLGQGGDDSLIELGGDSQIDGGAGFDSLFVWSDSGVTLNLATASIEWVQGSVLGDDNLNGAANTVDTYLYGWGGNDVLTGGAGNDYIAGGIGNDILTGGAGNDTMIGEAGVDRYVYTAATWGSDTIHSFDPNGEKLDFTAVASIHSFSDFTAYEWDPGNLGYNSTTLFHTDGGTTSAITLIGVQAASLSDSDFLFA